MSRGCPEDDPWTTRGRPEDDPRTTQGRPKDDPRTTRGHPEGVPRASRGLPEGVPRVSRGHPEEVKRTYRYPRDVQRISKRMSQSMPRGNLVYVLYSFVCLKREHTRSPLSPIISFQEIVCSKLGSLDKWMGELLSSGM
jgi:hypothetical protein